MSLCNTKSWQHLTYRINSNHIGLIIWLMSRIAAQGCHVVTELSCWVQISYKQIMYSLFSASNTTPVFSRLAFFRCHLHTKIDENAHFFFLIESLIPSYKNRFFFCCFVFKNRISKCASAKFSIACYRLWKFIRKWRA